MFTISNETDYAMLFVEYLHGKPEWVPLSRVVADLKLPRRFLAQIASKLASSGMVESKEGVSGGYRLKKKINEVNLYDFLKIFEGDLRLVKCSDGHYDCLFEPMCQHKTNWKTKITARISSVLREVKIEDVIFQSGLSSPTRSGIH